MTVAELAGVRVLLKPPTPPKPVPGMFTSSQAASAVVIPTATSWQALDKGGLRVYADKVVVAEFPAGEWVAVVANSVSPADMADMARDLADRLGGDV